MLSLPIAIGRGAIVTKYFTRDDTFYYLQIARNIAGGSGSTFDRLSTTNGYQLLWQWLLVPLAAVFHGGDGLLIAALLLAAALVAGGAALAGALCRSPVGVVLTVVLAFNRPTGLLTGMESALAFFMVALLVWLLARFRTDEHPRWWLTSACCAAIVALVFSRQDYVVVAGTLVVGSFLLRTNDWRRWVPLGVAAVGGLGLSFAAYFAIGGTVVPVSGLVKLQGISVGGRLRRAPVHFLAALFPFGRVPGVPERLVEVVGLAVVAIVVAVILRSGPLRAPELARTCAVVGAALVAYAAVTTIGVGFLADWYLAIAVYFYVLFVSWAVVELRHAAAWRAPVVVVSGALLAYSLIACAFPTPASDAQLYAARREIGRHLAADRCRFAAFNAGAIGYYSGGKFVNLDGVVNSRDYRDRVLGHPTALRAYLEARRVTVLVDYTFGSFTPQLGHYARAALPVRLAGSASALRAYLDPQVPCAPPP